MNEKEFSEYWAKIAKLNALPEMAIRQLPESLSTDTKEKLMKMRPEETIRILEAAIDQINNGSVESIDSLVRKRL